MIGIEQLVKVGAKQIELVVIALRTWSHGAPKLQETNGVAVEILQFFRVRPLHSTPSLPGSTHIFRDDYLASGYLLGKKISERSSRPAD